MATYNTQSFSSLVSSFATAVQGAATALVDFTTGSVLLAIDEAVAYVALWLQGLILQIGALTRASTSVGSDLDSWFAQFGFARLPAVTATMQETFARYTPTAQVLIPPGTLVQSQDGTVVFQAIVDTTNSNYSVSLGAYVLPASTSSINVTVQCATAGSIGNVQANTITSLATAISGVDYVTNPSATSNGVNAETDTAARARFVLFIASLSAATLAAIQNAVNSVQSGLTGIIAENKTFTGATQYGYFSAIMNNGSGTATSGQIAATAAAIEQVRPISVTYGITTPTPVVATVSMSIAVGAGYVLATVEAAVTTALTAYINSIQPTSSGSTLAYAALDAVAYGVPGVTSVTGTLLNGGTSDITATYSQYITAGAITVS